LKEKPEDASFGKLVQLYRKQRGWKQQELAEHWGFTREYVSQIERGRRKLDKQEQVRRLADILGIPEERLAAAGKTVPRGRPVEGREADDALLEALLAPAEMQVKLSWLLWHGDNDALFDIEPQLLQLIPQLENALALYHGQFSPQVFRLLAYTHEMLGKFAVDRINTTLASHHFQVMYDIAEEIQDSDMLMQAILHQADMLRRRGWQQASFQRLNAAQRLLPTTSLYLQGVFHKITARNHYVYGNEQAFLREITQAEDIARQTISTIDTANYEFDVVEVMQEKAQGYTMLWQPEKALAIYQETDKLRSFRPKRDLGSYTIIKAQAYCYYGELKTGIQLSEEGMQLAESYRSSRHVMRLRQMSDRLSVTKLGQEKSLKDLGREIYSTLEKMRIQ
jgi:transcriptional regulator with XRE-family HTH domain